MAQDGHVKVHRRVQFDLRRLRFFICAVGEPTKEFAMAHAIRPCDDEWLSLQQLGSILGKTDETLYNEIRRGTDLPPYYKFAQKYRWRKSEVDAWLAQFRRETSVYRLKHQASTSGV